MSLNPGTPVYYSPRFATMDMRTGDVSFGSFENELMDVAAAQIGRFYNIPVYMEGIELYLGALAGLNVIGGVGSSEAGLTQDIAIQYWTMKFSGLSSGPFGIEISLRDIGS